MPFPIKDWRDFPNTTTPITAAALEDLEARLSAYTEAAIQQFAEDSGVGRPGLRWVGPWDNVTAYVPDDVVSYPDPDIVGHLLTFVALAENTDFDPITGGTDVLLGTVQALDFHQSDQLASTTYVTKTITDASDINGGYDRPSEPVVIAKTGVAGPTISIQNLHGSRGLNFPINLANNGANLTTLLVPSGQVRTYDLPDDATDIWAFGNFDGSGGHSALYGSFQVKLDDLTNIEPPPPILPPAWAQMGG
jgi:hypothetical protein